MHPKLTQQEKMTLKCEKWIMLVVLCSFCCLGLSRPTLAQTVKWKEGEYKPIDVQNLTKIDPQRATKMADNAMLWYDARDLRIEGKGWTDTDNFYERLPARAQAKVPEAVWKLSKNTAGLCVRFVTDSKLVWASWTCSSPLIL